MVDIAPDLERTSMDDRQADLDFYFDPMCQFAYMASTWVRQVMAERDYEVEWRLISLRMLNANVNYAEHFPRGYLATHTAGLRMLRVAVALRAEFGSGVLDAYYAASGRHVFERPPWPDEETRTATLGTTAHVQMILADAGLPKRFSAHLDDVGLDEEIRAETEAALTLTGRDVGTPILQVDPPHGVAFFGPVISRRPSAREAVELWDHVVGLARFGGFSELKRSLRERLDLPVFGAPEREVGVEEDWHGGSRRLKR